MKKNYVFTTLVFFVLIIGSFNLKAQQILKFGPFTSDCVIEFDITPTANWSNFFIKPPTNDPNYAEGEAGYFQTRLLFGGGDVTIYNGDYQGGSVAKNFTFLTDGTKYNFRISLSYSGENGNLITVKAKIDKAADWIVLFDKFKQAYGWPNIGQIENSPGFLKISDLSASKANLTAINTTKLKQAELYPNPVENTLIINTPSLIRNIKVFSETGSLMKNIIISESRSASVNVDDLKSGVYFLHIATNDGDVVKKFVKK